MPEPLVEVWLIDTGIFVVLENLPSEYRMDFRWMKAMRLRRKLRMYLPCSEVQNLPGITKAFSIAKRGPEIRDSLRGFHEWYAERDRLESRRLALEEDATSTTEMILELQKQIQDHDNRKAIVFANSLRSITGLTLEFPSTADVSIKMVPFQARRVPWPVKKEEGKRSSEKRGS